MIPLRNTCAILGLCLLLSFSNVAIAATPADSPGSMTVAEAYAALPDCAFTCLANAMVQSPCTATDVTCLCNDHLFSDTAAACVRSSCTVKETLTTRNISSHMCGLPVKADDSLIPIYSTFAALAIVAVVLRLVARVVTQAYFWWDDLANLLSFMGAALFTGMNIKAIKMGQGKDIWFVPFDDVTAVVKMFFGDMLCYTIGRFFFRASIILFYIRIFKPKSDNSKFTRLLIGTMAFNLVYNFTFIMAIIFQCQPLPYFWTQWQGLHEGHCGNYNILAWVAAATGIAFDVWMLALPLSQLLALRIPWRKKIMGSLMFFFGVGVMIVSLIRLKTINEFTQTINPTKDIVQVCLWSGIELDVGVICPCLPSMRLLVRHMLGNPSAPDNASGGGRNNSLGRIPSNNNNMRSGGEDGHGHGDGDGGMGLDHMCMGHGMGHGMGGSRNTVENAMSFKYLGRESSDDGGETCVTSVTELVERRSSWPGDVGGGHGDGGKWSRY